MAASELCLAQLDFPLYYVFHFPLSVVLSCLPLSSSSISIMADLKIAKC